MTTDISELMLRIKDATNEDVELTSLIETTKRLGAWRASVGFTDYGGTCYHVERHYGDSPHEALCKLYDAVVAEKAKATGENP